MNDGLCFSSPDMVNWTQHPSPLNVKDFTWAKGDAWASQAIERHGKFYWYVAIEHKDGGKAIGVARLKETMTDLDGPIHSITNLPHYTEAPWIHKHNGWYYLSYAYEFPEKIAYAMSRNINGPWKFKGIINELAGNSNTNHQAIIDFKGKSYFIYHNGALAANAGGFHRSVCIDYLYYNKDGTIRRVTMTSEGVKQVTKRLAK